MNWHKQTHRQAGRQAGTQAQRHTGQPDELTQTDTDTLTGISQVDWRQTQTHRQTGSQTDRHTLRQTDTSLGWTYKDSHAGRRTDEHKDSQPQRGVVSRWAKVTSQGREVNVSSVHTRPIRDVGGLGWLRGKADFSPGERWHRPVFEMRVFAASVRWGQCMRVLTAFRYQSWAVQIITVSEP